MPTDPDPVHNDERPENYKPSKDKKGKALKEDQLEPNREGGLNQDVPGDKDGKVPEED